jgi:hypothetical protein
VEFSCYQIKIFQIKEISAQENIYNNIDSFSFSAHMKDKSVIELFTIKDFYQIKEIAEEISTLTNHNYVISGF